MDKEFEKALKCLEKLGDRAYKRYFFTEESLEELKKPIKQALLELKSIKEANSNETLKQVTYLSAILPDWQRVNNGVDSLSVIKQALTTKSKKEQALEIIKEKDVDIYIFQRCKTLNKYNSSIAHFIGETRELTQEEFDLLSEVLK